MVGLLLRWVLSAVALVIIAEVVPGLHASFAAALAAALVIGLINTVVRPIFVLLTLPLTILTFGLFIFILNAGLFALAAWLTPGFTVHGFRAALVGSILYAISGLVINYGTRMLMPQREPAAQRT
jgi:putative membrane protein